MFDLPLEAIRMPVLVVGHVADACIRSPAGLMGGITTRTNGAREQVVTVTGGPGSIGGPPSVEACQGRTPRRELLGPKLLAIRRGRAYTVVVWLDPGLNGARPSQTAFPRHFRFVGRALELAED